MFTKTTRESSSSSARFQTREVLTSTPITPRDDDERALDDVERRDRVRLEAGVAGRVDQVDLASLPLEEGERGGQRHLALLLVLVPVGDRAAGLDGAEAVDLAGLEEHRLDQRGLARPAMADDGDVADLPRLLWHSLAPLVNGQDGRLRASQS